MSWSEPWQCGGCGMFFGDGEQEDSDGVECDSCADRSEEMREEMENEGAEGDDHEDGDE